MESNEKGVNDIMFSNMTKDDMVCEYLKIAVRYSNLLVENEPIEEDLKIYLKQKLRMYRSFLGLDV